MALFGLLALRLEPPRLWRSRYFGKNLASGGGDVGTCALTPDVPPLALLGNGEESKLILMEQKLLEELEPTANLIT